MFYVYIIGATRPCLTTHDAGTVVVFLIQHGYEIVTDMRQDDDTRVVVVQKLKVAA